MMVTYFMLLVSIQNYTLERKGDKKEKRRGVNRKTILTSVCILKKCLLSESDNSLMHRHIRSCILFKARQTQSTVMFHAPNLSSSTHTHTHRANTHAHNLHTWAQAPWHTNNKHLLTQTGLVPTLPVPPIKNTHISYLNSD